MYNIKAAEVRRTNAATTGREDQILYGVEKGAGSLRIIM